MDGMAQQSASLMFSGLINGIGSGNSSEVKIFGCSSKLS